MPAGGPLRHHVVAPRPQPHELTGRREHRADATDGGGRRGVSRQHDHLAPTGQYYRPVDGAAGWVGAIGRQLGDHPVQSDVLANVPEHGLAI